MIFYNGFNLLVDIILAGGVGFLAYRLGFNDGYNAGEEDYIEQAERAGDYFYDQEREGW